MLLSVCNSDHSSQLDWLRSEHNHQPSIHRGGREVGRFEGEKRLVVGRHLMFLSKEEHRVAASLLFYKIEGEKNCIIRKAILGN
jgi:hypothetical protein